MDVGLKVEEWTDEWVNKKMEERMDGGVEVCTLEWIAQETQ